MHFKRNSKLIKSENIDNSKNVVEKALATNDTSQNENDNGKIVSNRYSITKPTETKWKLSKIPSVHNKNDDKTKNNQIKASLLILNQVFKSLLCSVDNLIMKYLFIIKCLVMHKILYRCSFMLIKFGKRTLFSDYQHYFDRIELHHRQNHQQLVHQTNHFPINQPKCFKG